MVYDALIAWNKRISQNYEVDEYAHKQMPKAKT